MKQEIKLGDKVKCIYTGFTGIALTKTEFINGCIQYSVASKWDKKTTDIPEVSIDSESLEVVKLKPKPRKKSYSGGPMRRAFKQRGY